jgi:hypothetical protein
MPIGNIAGPETIDSVSFKSPPTVPPVYGAAPIGGPVKECQKIKINIAESGEDAQYQNVMICDTSPEALSEDPYPSVPGEPPGTVCIRGPIIPTKNLSVYFEGQLVVVGGDGISGKAPPPTTTFPEPRILTEPTFYPNIIIGTNPI